MIDGSGYSKSISILDISLTEQDDVAARAVCLGSHAAVVTMAAVTRLLWLDSARTLRVVAVVLVARLARCARWLWLGSHDARVTGGAAGASQQLLYKHRTPNNIYFICSRAKLRRRFIN